MSKTRTVQLTIQGRVQGVGYRAWTVKTAQKLGLAGWVRNLASGEVEVLAHGTTAAVQSLIDACHKGPTFAHVKAVAVSEAESPADSPKGFAQRPSA